MSAFTDTLGLDALPPSPLYPIDRLTGGAPPPSASPSVGSGLDVTVGPPAGDAPAAAPPMAISPPAQGDGGGRLNLQQILGLLQPKQQSGFSVPSFMASLGAGLSSAGQNWNKPAAAAFAAGAGGAIQGGQQFQQQQQDAKLKALQAAIAAWKVGDITAYHQAIVNLRAASAPQRGPAPSAPSAASTAPPPPAPPASTTGSPNGPTVYGSAVPPGAATPPSAARSAGAPRIAPPDVMAQAKDAIARGASPEAVRQRLAENDFAAEFV